ncbi:MAG: hypothetical protein ACEQSK_16225 [Sphingomonadaceae bacterium]
MRATLRLLLVALGGLCASAPAAADLQPADQLLRGVATRPAPEWQAPPWATLGWRGKFEGEDLGCAALAPSGKLGVQGGYLWRIDLSGGIRRSFGARIHIYDVAHQQKIRVITVRELGPGAWGRRILPSACAFTPDERALLVVTGYRLSMYAVHSGQLLAEREVALGADEVALEFGLDVPALVRLVSGRRQLDFLMEQ